MSRHDGAARVLVALGLSITVLSACDRTPAPPSAYGCLSAGELDASEFSGANGGPVPADPAADTPVPCPAH